MTTGSCLGEIVWDAHIYEVKLTSQASLFLLEGEPFLINRLGLLEYCQGANIFLILRQYNSSHCPLGQTTFLEERWSIPSAAFRRSCSDMSCLCSAFPASVVLKMLVTGKNAGVSQMGWNSCSTSTQHREVILPLRQTQSFCSPAWTFVQPSLGPHCARQTCVLILYYSKSLT